MSQPGNKHPLNVPGLWYCTHPEDATGEGCIACSVCYTGAPDFFASDENGHAYVSKQPTTDEEFALCQEQLEACPVTSIGSNGE
jgi:ferredoxin